MRLSTAGALDTSFGSGGIKTFDLVADHDEKFNAIAVQGDEMVVAGGSGSDLLVARLADLYSNTLNIIYDSQGGSSVTDGDATTTTGGAIATLPTDPTRTGYTFNGWFTATSDGTEITAGDAHGQDADFTLYAQWQINTVTLAYDPQGGTGQPDAHVGEAGSAVTVSSIVPTRAGYTFAGWNPRSMALAPPARRGRIHPADGRIRSLFAQWQVTPQPRPPRRRLRRQPRRPPQLRRRPRWRQPPPPPRRLRRRPALCRHHRPPRLLLHQLPAPQPSPARSPKGRP